MTPIMHKVAQMQEAHSWLLVSSVTIASFLVLLDTSILANAIPKITSQFHRLQDIAWYGAAYQISSAVAQPLVGKVYSQFSSKLIFVAFFVCFELGSLVCALAVSSRMLIMGRAISGLGSAGVFAGALIIIGISVPSEKRAGVTGICIAFAQLGSLAGPLVGGVLTDKLSWRWCFYINLGFGIAVMLGIFICVRVDTDRKKTLVPRRQRWAMLYNNVDLVGFCLMALGTTTLVVALQSGGSVYPWNSAMIITLLCCAAFSCLLLTGWVWYRGDAALIPTTLFKNRIVVVSCYMSMAINTTSSLISYWMPIYFQAVLEKGPLGSAISTLPTILSCFIVGIVTGHLIGRIGYYLPFAVCGGALAVAAASLLGTLDQRSSAAQWVVYQLLLGTSRGLAQQVGYTAIQVAAPSALMPVAISTMVFSQNMGGALFLSLTSVSFAATFRAALARVAPGADAEAVLGAGASYWHNKSLNVKEIRLTYSASLHNVFFLVAGVAGTFFLMSFCCGWVNTNCKQSTSEGREDCLVALSPAPSSIPRPVG